MKRRLWFFRALALGMSAIVLGTTPVSAEELQSPDKLEGEQTDSFPTFGFCGEDAMWEYDKTTHTLQITGNGKMDQFHTERFPLIARAQTSGDWEKYPWEAYRDEIEQVHVTSGITAIGSGSFKGLTKLTQVEIADTVTEIGEYAFANCPLLTAVTIPEGVTTIDSGAFYDDSNLEEIHVAQSVTKIGAYAFEDTLWLIEQIRTDPTVIVNGVLISCQTRGKETVEIPKGVTHIAANTFAETSMTEVIVSDGVKSIDSGAFYMSRLQKITIPDSVTEIGTGAFFPSTSVVIYANTGSYAQQFATENGFTFVSLNAKKKSSVINVKKTYENVYGKPAFSLNAKLKSGNGKLTYSSSNRKVATVNAKGEVQIKGCGMAVITINAAETDQFSASHCEVTIKARPKKQTIRLKSTKSRQLSVLWKKDSSASGYQMQYSTDKKFQKNTKSVFVNKNSVKGAKITKLSEGKTYYVRVRSYKSIRFSGKDKTLYGDWSAKKHVMIKNNET
ncbi:MAG: leucine-rich repeat protein [Lachnospiraceae bacterium]